MDAMLAQSLASSMDPKSLSSLQNRNNDPAVAKAVAGQFGAFLMQSMMQDADGTALGMTSGTGGAAVNSMFASTMSRFAMSGDKLGLADMIYRSTAGKTEGAAPPATGAAVTPTAASSIGAAVTPTAAATKPAPAAHAITLAHGAGISLTPYWDSHGHRPLGPAVNNTLPSSAGIAAAAKISGESGHNAKTATRSDAVAKLVAATASRNPVAPRTNVTTAAPAAATAAASSPANAAANAGPHPDRSFWDWLGVPSLVHFFFPGSDHSAQPAAAAQGAVASPAGQGNATPAVGAANSVPAGSPGATQPIVPQATARSRTSGPDAQASGTGAGPAATAAAHDFVHRLAPSITEAAQRLGVSPRVLLAQAALETGWGHSVVGNNIFGIKAGASWPGATVTASTHEMESGRMVAHRAAFRSYDNVGQAVDDYVSLVSASNRYRSALGSGDDPATYAAALTAGGYATDRDYAAKLTAVADGPTMSDAVAALDESEPGQLVSRHG